MKHLLIAAVLGLGLSTAAAADDDPPWSEQGYCKLANGGGYGQMNFGSCRELAVQSDACWLGNLDGPQWSSISCD